MKLSNVFKLKLSSLLNAMYFYIPIFTLFLIGHGITLANVVLAQALYSLFAFLFEVPTGVFADKIGQKYSVLLGVFLDAFGLFLLILFPSVITLYLCQSIRGISSAAISGSYEALMYEFVKEEQGSHKNYKKEYGTFISNGILGFTVSTFITGVIVEIYGDASHLYIFILTIGALLSNLVLVLSIGNPLVHIKNAIAGRHLFYEIQESWKLINKSLVIRVLMFTFILTYAGKYFLMETYPLYFKLHDVRPIFIGTVLSVGSLLNFFVVKYSYLLEKHFRLPFIVFMVSCTVAIGYISLGIFHSPMLLILSFIITYVVIEAEKPIISDFINAKIPTEIRSTALSAVNLTREAANLSFKFLLAFSLGVLGNRNTYLMFGLYLFVGAIATFILLRTITRNSGAEHEFAHPK